MKNILLLIGIYFILIGCGGSTIDTNIEDNTIIEIPISTVDDNVTDETNQTEDNNSIDIPISTPNVDDNISDETNQTEENITIDTTPPIIRLNGDDNIYILQGEIYIELGAVAEDNNKSIYVHINGFVDNFRLGEYIVTYSATNQAGDSASISRTINVVTQLPQIDTTPPQIVLNGEANISILQGDIYNELGAVAEDNNISIPVDVYGVVDTNTLGEYNITYSATDEAGNSASILRQVLVKARRIPYNIVETIPQNWYIRLVAKDLTREFKTENTQLGVLEEDNSTIKHSLKALAPFGSTYLDIVFPNPAGVPSGEYKSSFHKSSSSLDNVWNMRVKTDNVSATIELSWRGLYTLTAYRDGQNRTRYREKYSTSNPLMQYMKLIDTTSGVEIPAIYDGKLQKYQISMEGQTTKDFQWVVSDNIVDINISNITPPLSRRARVVGTISNNPTPPAPIEPFDIHQVPRSDTFDRYTK